MIKVTRKKFVFFFLFLWPAESRLEAFCEYISLAGRTLYQGRQTSVKT